ncbi:uncharacterized protein LOC143245565 [Tachypleus tridentatus]|uniref:uncharacterized protein LOC143245565 n=1 Tax=Tachypleus tridentatus TaxID=6853 RepID=UPI003FD25378
MYATNDTSQKELNHQKMELLASQTASIEVEKKQAHIKAEKEKTQARIEAETNIKLKEMEIRLKNNNFELNQCVKVASFNENEVDKYFRHFENGDQSMEWSIEKWSLLLQRVLTGKTQETSHELVLEAYRQKFRGYRTQNSQTYMEFAPEKEVYFDQWYNSMHIGNTFYKLIQLYLIEECKHCTSDDLKTYLDEKKVKTIQEATILSDDCT